MEQTRSPASSSTLIDALVLACSHSHIRDIVGTDALRSVLELEYRQASPAGAGAGAFDLEPVWRLFLDQPGLDREEAIAVLCRFKSWEPLLGTSIVLPAELGSLGAGDIAARAATCQVPAAELQALLRGAGGDGDPIPQPYELAESSGRRAQRTTRPLQLGEDAAPGRDRSGRVTLGQDAARSGAIPASGRGQRSTMPPPSGRGQRSTMPPPAGRSPRSTLPLSEGQGGAGPEGSSWSRRRRVLQLAVVVAVVSFGFAGLSLYRGCRTSASWKELSASFAGSLPIDRPERIGDQVRARLSDTSWLDEPREQRDRELGQALRALQPQGITVLFLQDAHGRVRATAQLYAGGTKMRFVYPE